MRVPDHLARSVVKRPNRIIAEIGPVEPSNRAWVRISMATNVKLGRNLLAKPDAPVYVVFRFEMDRERVADEMRRDSDRDHFRHVQRYQTQDIAEAFEKAQTYEPDWSKWGTYEIHPDCP